MLLPALVGRVHGLHDGFGRLLRRAGQSPRLLGLVQRVGSLATALPGDVLEELALEFSAIDVEVYLRTLRSLGEHDAHEVLGAVAAPTLIIAGARDLFTPRSLSERMASALARGELVVIPRGTHYTATEYPELVNRQIELFLARHPGVP
jgi:pimeloyl-ACP methyl ester carboxylesterase